MTTNNVVGNPTGVALIRTARYFPLKATCSSTSNGEEKTCVSDSGTCQTSLVPSLPFARDSTIFREGTSLDVHAKIEDYSDSWSFDREPPRVRPSFSRRDDDEPRSITSFRREKCKEIGEGSRAKGLRIVCRVEGGEGRKIERKKEEGQGLDERGGAKARSVLGGPSVSKGKRVCRYQRPDERRRRE